MNNERTISINPQFLNISKKKMKVSKPNTDINTSEVKLNTTNIRQLLLEKLRQHKKKKNQKTQKFPVQLNTMDEQIKLETIEKHIPLNKFDICSTNNMNINTNNVQPTSPKNQSDKPYGNLKNGNKPTFKTWTKNEPITLLCNTDMPNSDMSNTDMSNVETFKPIILKPVLSNPMPEPSCSVVQQKEIKKTFNIGKNKKENAVNILIKNNNTRKKIESDKISLKKTSLATLKNFLKKQNLIKFGSTAPNHLLREIYENTKLCGDIINENPQNILHNFKET
jgi:hypothetical protein